MTDVDPRNRAEQIAHELRQKIASGSIPAGGKLPTVRELADRHHVTRATAGRAISLLTSQGVVTPRTGSGVYVRESHPVRRVGPERYARRHWECVTVDVSSDPQGTETVQQDGSQTQAVAYVAADAQVAEALGIEVGATVVERARIVTRKGAPTHSMTSYYRPGDVEGTEIVDPRPGMAGRRGGFHVLTEQGLRPVTITEELHARMPKPDELHELELPAGEPIVEVHRTTRAEDGRAIEFARGIHAASRFVWAYTFEIPD